MKTPQKATVDGRVARHAGDAGRQRRGSAASPGALKFQARVRVAAAGRQDRAGRRPASPSPARIPPSLLIAAATSYKSFKDVSGDPEALTKDGHRQGQRRSRSTRCSRTTWPSISGCSAACTLDLGATDAAQLSDRRADRDLRQGERSATGGALLPVRPLPADLQLAARRPAGEPPGPLERQHEPALGQQVHDQHQHRDELLAGRADATSASASSRWSRWWWT